MFVVKAHAAEDLEQWRFERLAWAERDAQLGKKRMKAFIPEMITLVYVITVMVLFGVGTWAISKGTLDGGGMVSFITSLVLLVEPMQVYPKQSWSILAPEAQSFSWNFQFTDGCICTSCFFTAVCKYSLTPLILDVCNK